MFKYLSPVADNLRQGTTQALVCLIMYRPDTANHIFLVATYVDSGNTGRFLGLWSVFSSAAFSLGGPDYIAITAAETVNPRRNVGCILLP